MRVRPELQSIFLALSLAGCRPRPTSAPDPSKQAGIAPERPATVAESDPTNTADRVDLETIEKLRRFKRLHEEKPRDDETGLRAMSALSSEIPETQLSTVEQFAATEEAEPVVWPLIRLLVERGRLEAAAGRIVDTLQRNPEQRKYRMWKWWEYNFGDRADYMELSRKIGDALLDEFAKGPNERKEVIVEIFGKGPAEARLTPEQFRGIISRSESP